MVVDKEYEFENFSKINNSRTYDRINDSAYDNLYELPYKNTSIAEFKLINENESNFKFQTFTAKKFQKFVNTNKLESLNCQLEEVKTDRFENQINTPVHHDSNGNGTGTINSEEGEKSINSKKRNNVFYYKNSSIYEPTMISICLEKNNSLQNPIS